MKATLCGLGLLLATLLPLPAPAQVPAPRPVAFAACAQEVPAATRARLAEFLRRRVAADGGLASDKFLTADQARLLDAACGADAAPSARAARGLAVALPAVARLVADCADPDWVVPPALPAVLADPAAADPGGLGLPAGLAADLRVHYAAACAARRGHDDVLAALEGVDPEATGDPAGLHFLRGAAAFALGDAAAARRDLLALGGVAGVPRRHADLARLMLADLDTWQTGDLDWLSRRMDQVRDRLAAGRGGKRTQRLERAILARLDELIKAAENARQGKDGAAAGECPDGGARRPQPSQGQAQADRSAAPAPDSHLPAGSGQGAAERQAAARAAADWGNLPEKDRAGVQQGLARRVPEKYQGVIRSYLDRIGTASGARPAPQPAPPAQPARP